MKIAIVDTIFIIFHLSFLLGAVMALRTANPAPEANNTNRMGIPILNKSSGQNGTSEVAESQ